MSTLFSLPTYIPDITSSEVVIGYEVQSSVATPGQPVFSGVWTDLIGSPFTTPNNILDINDASTTEGTRYRARPVRQVTYNGQTVTLDTPWSRTFTASSFLYDFPFTRFLLPYLRQVFLKDEGMAQTNGTVITETTGAGNGLIIPNGVQTRFPLQYVFNDDPIKLLDSFFTVTKAAGNGPTTGQPYALVMDEDYSVDVRNGIVSFKTAPLPDDYIRIDFRKVDLVNDDLLSALTTAVNSLSHFGLSGFYTSNENNLVSLGTAINQDLMDIVCLVAMFNMREGLTEQAMRSTLSWRDGGINEDPFPSRAMEFFVEKIPTTQKSIQQRVNAYIRSSTTPIGKGDFDLMFAVDYTSPFNTGFLSQAALNWGFVGALYGPAFYSSWL